MSHRVSRRAFGIAAAAACIGTPLRAQTSAAWDKLQAQLLSSASVVAFMVVQRDAPLFAHFRQGTNASTPWPVASITKSVVSLLAGIAIERGFVSGVDASLAELFGDEAMRADTLQRVKLRHLLTLTTGFDHRGLDENTDYLDFLQRLYAPGLLAHALSRPLVDEPGQRFYYSNMDAHLASVVVSRRAKRPLADFARDEFFRPLGIERFEWTQGQDGSPDGAGGLRLAPADLLKIGQLMLAGGTWQGRSIVPRAYLDQAVAKHTDTDLPPRGPRELWGYGFLWWLSSTPGDRLRAFYAAGYGGQFIYVVPALELVVVAVTEQASRNGAARTAALIRDFALPAVPR